MRSLTHFTILLIFCNIRNTKSNVCLDTEWDDHLTEFSATLKSIQFKKLGSDLSEDAADILKYHMGLKNEDKHLDGFKLMKKYKYPYKKYTVGTEDGYDLLLVRMPSSGQPVLIGHGLLCTFQDFLTAGPHHALAYVLFRAGYDVWMINFRGNRFSKNHKFISPKNASYWDFSFHELGTRDLPATIDFVLAKTKYEKLIYIGHSQGTTSVFVLLSEIPEYNSKMLVVVALSPVAWMKYVQSPLVRALAPFCDLEYFISKTIGRHEFIPEIRFVREVTKIMCTTSISSTAICGNIISLFAGVDFKQINHTSYPVEIAHVPSSVATKQIIHYLQEINSEKFQQFDYGSQKNLRYYGKATPPKYNVSKITAAVALFYATNDWLSNERDVKKLWKKLPNVVLKYLVPFPEFNHVDFMWAKDVNKLVYDKVLELLSNHTTHH